MMSVRSMMRVGLGVLAACGGATSTATPVVEPDPESTRGAEGSTAVVATTDAGVADEATAAGRGATEAEALAAARSALRVRVLGPWGHDATIPLDDPARDVTETAAVDGGYEARIILGEERLRELLRELPERLPRPAFTGSHAAPLQALQVAALEAFVCERRRALFPEEECEMPELEPLQAAAREVTRGLALEPLWAGGVPVDAEGRALRKPAVALTRGDSAVGGASGLPLVAGPLRDESGEREPLRTTVDGEGRAVVNADLGEGLVVTLDRSRLLPALAAVFGELRAVLAPRPVGLQRWALVLAEDVVRDGSNRGAFDAALGEVLRDRGAGPRRRLEAGSKRVLSGAPAGRRPASVRAIADEQGGAVDVVLVATVESRFASRMGTRRTWYEATASVTAYLAWTGEALGTFEARANANGIGDARAERAARENVARDLARQLADGLLSTGDRS